MFGESPELLEIKKAARRKSAGQRYPEINCHLVSLLRLSLPTIAPCVQSR
jgi:hypothetical protein